MRPVDRWWPRVPWQTVAEAPAWSHGVEHLRRIAALPDGHIVNHGNQ